MCIHTRSERWGGDWRGCVYVSCSPGRPVFGEDLLSSSGPPTPFRALPTSSSSPPPLSPSKPCSRQSSSSDTDLSLTPKTGKNTWRPIPLSHSHPSWIPHLICGATRVVVFFLIYLFIFTHFVMLSLTLISCEYLFSQVPPPRPQRPCVSSFIHTIDKDLKHDSSNMKTHEISVWVLSPLLLLWSFNGSTVSHEGLWLI